MRTRRRRGLGLAAVGIAVLACTAVQYRYGRVSIVRESKVMRAPPAATPRVTTAGPLATAPPSLPNSLRGTAVPDDVRADDNGDLVINRALRNFYDYFLSAGREEPPAEIRQRVIAAAAGILPARARQQLLMIYDQYVGYRTAVVSLAVDTTDGGLRQATARLAAIRRLRADMLPPDVVRAFFAADDAYDDYEMTQASILKDPTLSPGDKAQRLTELRADLPSALREAITVSETVQTLNAVTADWRQRGGSAAELHAIRSEMVGEDAAQRLEALDAENAQWSARVDAYMSQRSQIQSDPTLTDAERTQSLDDLRTKTFPAAEGVRITALERSQDTLHPQ